MIQLNDLSKETIELSDEKLSEIKGGAIGLGASSAALGSIGGAFGPFQTPTAAQFLGNTFIGGLIPALGIAATVASGGTVPLLVAGASLKD